MKKLLLSFLAILFALPSFAYGSYDFKIGKIYYHFVDQDEKTVEVTYEVWDGRSYSGDIDIPSTVNYSGVTYTVVGIRSFTFDNCTNLQKVTIPNTVTYIGSSAFDGCTRLTSVNIPDGITSIEQFTFRDCRGLTSIDIPQSVTSIGNGAFKGCNGLRSIDIPQLVTSIGNGAFDGCNYLTKVNISDIEAWCKIEFGASTSNPLSAAQHLFLNGEEVTALKIPSSITAIGNYAFYNCNSLTSVDIPNSVTSIGGYAFEKCGELISVDIPNTITSMGTRAFYYCNKLKKVNITDIGAWCSINFADSNSNPLYHANHLYLNGEEVTALKIPSTTTSIGKYAFFFCYGFTSIDIPETVTSIGDEAFGFCNGVNQVLIPKSVTTMGSKVFRSSGIKSLILLNDISETEDSSHPLAGMNTSTKIWCIPSTYTNVKTVFGNTYQVYPLIYEELNSLVSGLKFKFNRLENASIDWGDKSDDKVTVKVYKQGESTAVQTMDCVVDREYLIRDLDLNTPYTFEYTVQNTPYDGTFSTNFVTFTTLSYNYTRTQTTITITALSAFSDETAKPTRYEVVGDSQIDYARYEYDGSKLTIPNLVPGRSYSFELIAWYGNEKVSKSVSISTLSMNTSTQIAKVGPTSAVLTGSYTAGDAKITKTEWTGDFKMEGNTLVVNGLMPSTTYKYNFYVYVNDYVAEVKSGSFKTTELTLTTLQPQCTTSTTANVAAETNLGDEETGAGFQWKKYDAPASLAPSEGYAIVADGRLEGQIKGLQSTSYYNVRALYKSADGTYFYGDWVTFDPSDFSYFDPTVRTYGEPDVKENSVTFKGYALSGSDPILSQGFHYWMTNASGVRPMTTGEVHTINASGQVMTVTVSDLPNGEYTFRAFVETATGFHYGDEQTFSIDFSGVENVVIDESEPEIIGYFDINGRRYAAPFKGLNIILYDNGTSRKVIMK